jgi:hypothetical protein
MSEGQVHSGSPEGEVPGSESEGEAAGESHKRKAAGESPKRKAADESPKREAADESPKREAARESPKRKAARASPKREAARESPKREAARESPKRKPARASQKREAARESPKREAARESPKRKAVRRRPPKGEGVSRHPKGDDGANRERGGGPEGNETSYGDLYRQWEEASWSATSIDFSDDARHWDDRLDTIQRASALWNYAMFLTGVETVAQAVTAEVAAAPGYQSAVFLSTQVADEARQHVFMDRFMREVAGRSRPDESVLRRAQDHLPWGLRKICDALDSSSEALIHDPQDRSVLAQTVLLSHIVMEGVLAIPGQTFIQRWVKQQRIMSGFAEGISHINRDEARHVTFGIKLLNDLMDSSGVTRTAVVRMLDRVVPWAVGVFVPPRFDQRYVECFGFTLEEIYAFGLRALEQRVAAIGVDPGELFLFKRDDRSLTHEQRARRLLKLVETGVLGDDRRTPEPDEDAMAIIFEATARSTDIGVARELDGPIEWAFADVGPWHVSVVDGRAEARSGSAGAPALRLELEAADWARIAVGRLDPRLALISRRMKVHGDWHALKLLPKLFTA